MSIEEAVEKLQGFADEFAKIGDAKEEYRNNPDAFMHKWVQVMQYYDWCTRQNMDSTQRMIALSTVMEIAEDNPSLKAWVDQIIDIGKKNQGQEPTEKVDPSAVISLTHTLINELNTMNGWDTEKAADIEWKLQKLQEKAKENQSYFDPNQYANLMDTINAALGKITNTNSKLQAIQVETAHMDM